MKRILIWELKSPVGGVENVIMNYLRHFDSGEIVPDIMFKGDVFPYEKEIEDIGGRVIYMPLYLPNVCKYRSIVDSVFRETSYDAVWCNYSGLTNIEVLKKAKEYGVPIRIAHSHVTSLSWGSPLAKLIVVTLHNKNKKIIDKYATDYWCCTENAGKFMFPEIVWSKLLVVKNAIDLDRYAFGDQTRKDIRARYGIGEELVVGHIGRFATAKNQKFLLDVFKEIKKKVPQSKLLFVADGELEEEIKKYAKENDVIDVIFVTGISDVSKYYGAMDVFLLPSLHEGLGMTLIEAQMSGTPCLASTKVPRDTEVSSGIEYLDLDKGPKEWANTALKLSKNRIDNTRNNIESAGYDITKEAKEVQKLLER